MLDTFETYFDSERIIRDEIIRDGVGSKEVKLKLSGFRCKIKLDGFNDNKFAISTKSLQTPDFLCICELKGQPIVVLLEFKSNLFSSGSVPQIKSGYYLAQFICHNIFKDDYFNKIKYIGFIVGRMALEKKYRIKGRTSQIRIDHPDIANSLVSDPLPIYRFPIDSDKSTVLDSSILIPKLFDTR